MWNRMVVYKQQSQEIITRLSDIWFALIDIRCLFVTTRIRQKAVVQMQNKRKLNLLSVKSSHLVATQENHRLGAIFKNLSQQGQPT